MFACIQASNRKSKYKLQPQEIIMQMQIFRTGIYDYLKFLYQKLYKFYNLCCLRQIN